MYIFCRRGWWYVIYKCTTKIMCYPTTLMTWEGRLAAIASWEVAFNAKVGQSSGCEGKKFHSAYSAEFAKVETLEKKLLEVDVISRSVVMQILTARECIQAGLWECRVPRIKIDIIFDYIVDIVEEQMVRQEKGGTWIFFWRTPVTFLQSSRALQNCVRYGLLYL